MLTISVDFTNMDRNSRFFFLLPFLMEVGLILALFATPLLAIRLGASVLQLGVMGSLVALCYTVGTVFLGHLADKVAKRKMLWFACGSFVLVVAITPHIGSVWAVTVLYAFSGGISMAFFWPCLEVWIAEGKSGSVLLKAVGSFNVAWGLGSLVAPFIAGFLYQIHYRIPFYLAALIALVIPVGLLRGITPSQGYLADAGNSSQNNKQADLYELNNDEVFLRIAWVANFVSWFILANIRNLFPKLAFAIGFSTQTLGILITLMALSQVVAFFILPKINNWHYRLSPLLWSQGMGIAGMTVLFFCSKFEVLALAMLAVGGLGGITYTSSIFYSLHRERNRGTMSGFHEAVLGGGALVGPLLGGIAGKFFGLRAPYLLCLLLLLGAMIFESFLFYFQNLKVKNAISQGGHYGVLQCDQD